MAYVCFFGCGGFFFLFIIFFVILFAFLLVRIWFWSRRQRRWEMRQQQRRGAWSESDRAQMIARRRYARGEITREQYQQLQGDLGRQPPLP